MRILRRRIVLVVGLVVILALAGTGAALAAVSGSGGGSGDDDQPITGAALAKCTAAALAEHPDGTVTETEVGDDGAAYGVEIRLADGSEIEVHLNKNCQVTGQEADDDDGPNDQDGSDDDDGPNDQEGSDDDDGPNDQDGPDDDEDGTDAN